MIESPVSEIVLSRIWHDGWHSSEMRLTDGRRLSVVYHGAWTHSEGPDFRDAMIDLDGRLVQGPVEIHLRSSHWRQHGHHTDPTYDDVVLHVVLVDDLPDPVSGPAGAPVPTVEIEQFLSGPLESYLDSEPVIDLGSLGSRTCLPSLAGGRSEEVRRALRAKGWERLVQKQLRFQQDLEWLPAGEVLLRGILDGLGLVRNRDGMAAVADLLPLRTLDAITGCSGRSGIFAGLLGVAGFLPLSPAHQDLAGLSPDDSAQLEALFREFQPAYELDIVDMSVWSLNRVRPNNHPVRRLASLASLLDGASERGLLARFLDLPLNDGAGWKLWLGEADPPIGAGRQEQIMVNVLAPFGAAYAEATGDEALTAGFGSLWERLPGRVDDSVARKTKRQIVGDQRFPIRLAIEDQGLHQIGRHGCSELRCFECPIAGLALRYEAGRL